jgi:transposase
VEAYLAGEGSLVDLAEAYGIGVRTLHGWVVRARCLGDLVPRTSPGRPRKLEEVSLAILRDLVAADNDGTLPDLARVVARRTGVKVSRQTIGRALQYMDVTRKKSLATTRNAVASVLPDSAPGSVHASRPWNHRA